MVVETKALLKVYNDAYKTENYNKFPKIYNEVANFIVNSLCYTKNKMRYRYTVLDFELNESLNYNFGTFYLLECSGWKFGIELTRPTKYENENLTDDDKYISFTIFGNRIENPASLCSKNSCFVTYSMIKLVDIGDVEKVVLSLNNVIEMLHYIRKHPIRAWYRDMTGYDYNTHYINSIKILSAWCRYNFKRFAAGAIGNLLTEINILFIENNVLPFVDYDETHKAYIKKMEFNQFPEYQIYCPVPYYVDIQSKVCFSLLDINTTDEGKLLKAQKVKKRWESLKSKCHRVAELLNITWYIPCYDCVIYYYEE